MPGGEAQAEVADVEGVTVAGELETHDTQNLERSTQNSEPESGPQLEQLRAELEGIRSQWLESHRRALLAENAGKIAPELVAGSSVEELDRSVAVARSAFEAARAAVLMEIAAIQVPAGNPIRQGAGVEAMSPMEKIAYGLKRD